MRLAGVDPCKVANRTSVSRNTPIASCARAVRSAVEEQRQVVEVVVIFLASFIWGISGFNRPKMRRHPRHANGTRRLPFCRRLSTIFVRFDRALVCPGLHKQSLLNLPTPTMADVMDAEKLPVTIITGFLGAGKTTLVNHILKGDHGKLIAVIENEFGAVSIDDALVGENMKEKEDIITMDNGCVCCTVRGDLVRALLTLKDRPKKFDHVIIETTGLADPAPVAFTFFINPEIADAYRIDSILCLADAKHIGIHLEEEKPDGAVNEAVSQVAFADRILLNKIDLVSEAELSEVVDTVKSINAVAEVIKTTNSVIDLNRVLGVNSFSIEKTLEVDPDFLEDEEGHLEAEKVHEKAAAGDDSHGHSHDGGKTECHDDHGNHDHGHGHGSGSPPPAKKPRKKRHDLTGVSSVGILAEGELDFALVNTFMMNLLQENALNIYRSKGVMKFKDQGNVKFVFQGVHEQINFGPSNVEWGKDEKVVNRMVFIGRNLNRTELEEGFRACLAK